LYVSPSAVRTFPDDGIHPVADLAPQVGVVRINTCIQDRDEHAFAGAVLPGLGSADGMDPPLPRIDLRMGGGRTDGQGVYKGSADPSNGWGVEAAVPGSVPVRAALHSIVGFGVAYAGVVLQPAHRVHDLNVGRK